MSDPKPTLGPITKANGVAGQVGYSVAVTYPDEPTSTVTFVGYPGDSPAPVVMITPANPKGVIVTEPSRFGPFGKEWVARFFA